MLLGASEDVLEVIQNAATLVMSDLATAVVTEFTSLAGIMGRHYALRDGFSKEVVGITLTLEIDSTNFSILKAFRNSMVSVTDLRGSLWDHTSAIFRRSTSTNWCRYCIGSCWQVMPLAALFFRYCRFMKFSLFNPRTGFMSSFLVMTCRLDSLVGLFAAGCQPSSTNDPFGLRRTSYGLVCGSIVKRFSVPWDS